jgi:hypothetical protein
LRLLLDEMYPSALAGRLRAAAVDSATVADLGLAGRSDSDVFTTAVAQGYTLLTENVVDFTRIAADHLTAGHHHPGVLIALSSRFSRRPAGVSPLVAAICAVASGPLDDRVVYLQRADPH